jgi:dihydrodipicolinate synthase/N-acetylneuraminate lyase
VVIPACPLALDAQRKLDERRQRALLRYYIAAGAGGVAVGVHTTQFAIRDPQIGLFEPVLTIAAEEMKRAEAGRSKPLVKVAGVCGMTEQAVAEATFARELGYDAVLLSLAAMKDAGDDTLVEHCRVVSETMPLIGFYLQPAVGGRVLPFSFWRRFAEIEGNTALIAVQGHVVAALAVLKWPEHPCVVAAARYLHLDNVGPEIGQNHGTVWTGQNPRKIQKLNAGQRLLH